MSRATSSSSGSSSSSAARRSHGAASRSGTGYFARSELPLVSLAFLLPFIVLYEVGTWYYASDRAGLFEQRIIAFNLMQDFFRLFGASGRYLPAMTVVLVLLCWHLARQDPWGVEPRYLVGMFVESALLAIPLIGIGFVATHYLHQYLPLFGAGGSGTGRLIVLSIGAGIYEELVFRLIAFTMLSFLLIDLMGMKRGWAGLLMVVSSSLLFSAYHYLGSEAFDIRIFAFRTVAGGYFGAVFLFRGLGITAGSHAAYDICVVVLRAVL